MSNKINGFGVVSSTKKPVAVFFRTQRAAQTFSKRWYGKAGRVRKAVLTIK